MTVKFDELELFKGPDEVLQGPRPVTTEVMEQPPVAAAVPAPRWRRTLAFATDASLFLALTLAMSPLLEIRPTFEATVRAEWPALLSFAAFILLLSFHYFVVSWAVWGRTVGGSIFDTRVASEDGSPIDFKSSARRWGWMLASIATCGLGFLIALLPGGRSLSDRMSQSRSLLS